MTIFFIASLYGKQQYGAHYEHIVKLTRDSGHTIQADHILTTNDQEMATWDEATDTAYHKKILDDLKKADALFVEASYSSTSVGYLIALAAQTGKPVVIFYSGTHEPHLLKTLEKTNDKLQVVRYKTLKDLDSEMSYVIDFVTGSQDVRFNFFVSPALSSYLDWVAKKKKIPRSVYLRHLIDQDMAKQNYQ